MIVGVSCCLTCVFMGLGSFFSLFGFGGLVACVWLTIEILVLAGCSVVWLARLIWDQEVAGSNPVTPMIKDCLIIFETVLLNFAKLLFIKCEVK